MKRVQGGELRKVISVTSLLTVLFPMTHQAAPAFPLHPWQARPVHLPGRVRRIRVFRCADKFPVRDRNLVGKSSGSDQARRSRSISLVIRVVRRPLETGWRPPSAPRRTALCRSLRSLRLARGPFYQLAAVRCASGESPPPRARLSFKYPRSTLLGAN